MSKTKLDICAYCGEAHVIETFEFGGEIIQTCPNHSQTNPVMTFIDLSAWEHGGTLHLQRMSVPEWPLLGREGKQDE